MRLRHCLKNVIVKILALPLIRIIFVIFLAFLLSKAGYFFKRKLTVDLYITNTEKRRCSVWKGKIRLDQSAPTYTEEILNQQRPWDLSMNFTTLWNVLWKALNSWSIKKGHLSPVGMQTDWLPCGSVRIRSGGKKRGLWKLMSMGQFSVGPPLGQLELAFKHQCKG